MRFNSGVLAAAAAAMVATASTRADVLDDWNQVLLQTFRETGGGPGFMARSAAMMHVAMYDAIACFKQSHEAVIAPLPAPKAANRNAAAAAAAHRVLSSIYPERSGIYNAALNASLAAIPDGPAENKGVRFGREIADAVIAARADDGAFATLEYQYGNRPGDWIITEPDINPNPVGPHWGNVQPWVLQSGNQFRPLGPGGFARLDRLLASRLYARQLNETKLLGERNSAARTTEETEIAWFWANDRPGTYHPPGQLLDITQIVANQERVAFADKARLYALVSIGMADTAIAVWDRKYYTSIDLWRPVTAIRNADLDGNDLTDADPTWEPLLDFTPPFPAYPSGHAAFGAVHAAIMAAFFGTDEIAFTATTDEPIVVNVTRTFNSFSEAARENGLSRVYLGVHYRFDADASFSLGSTIGQYVYGRIAKSLCPGDMDSDGRVDAVDMNMYTNSYFRGTPDADLNKDDSVDYLDMTMYVDMYLNGCSSFR